MTTSRGHFTNIIHTSLGMWLLIHAGIVIHDVDYNPSMDE